MRGSRLSKLTNANVLGKSNIRDMNSWAIHELLHVNLAKIQYTRDDEGYIFAQRFTNINKRIEHDTSYIL